MQHKTGLGNNLLLAIHSAMVYPIRELGKDKFAVLATVEIGRCAVDYCGADIELSGPAISESASLLREKFSGFSLDEVREAFMLAVSKRIDANLAAYSGQFTVRLFGEVMYAYEEFRRPLFAEMVKEMVEQGLRDAEEEKQARNAKTREQIVEEFGQMCRGELQPFENTDSIPNLWAKVLVEEMQIFGNPSTWIEAKKTVVERFKSAQSILMADETLSAFDAKRVYLALKNEPDIFPEELKPRAIGLYGRLLVFNEITRQRNLKTKNNN